MKIYIALLFSVLVSLCAGADTWGYSELGRNWPEDGYPICGNRSQTPVDIKDSTCDEKLNNSISYSNYEITANGRFPMKNNGHTLVLTLSSIEAEIKFDTPDSYKLEQMHFHWGNDSKRGSEHLLMGKAFPAELHMVHYNKKYGQLGKAADKEDGLAVLGIFIEEGSENPTFKKFLRNATEVKYKDNETNVDAFKMEDLLPKTKDAFYRYSGSLTTPPCYESVKWTVFEEVVYASKEQLQQLRSLKDGENKPLVDNYREVQKLNGRSITYWSEAKCPSGAAALGASILSLTLLFFFTLF